MASFNPFKHLKPQDREVRSSGDLHEMYKTMAAMIDLSHLSEEEKEKILQVLQRDEDLRKVEERRITRRKSELGSELEDADSKLKQEFQEVKKKSAVKPAEVQNSEKNCSRCQTAFGFFFDTGNPCPQCQHKVCNSCREFTTPKKDKWLCALCNKQRLLKIETGEWFYETMDPKRKDQLFGTDLIRASLRRPRGRGRGRPQPVGDQIRPALTGSRERVQDVGRSQGRGRDRTAQQSPRRDGHTDPQSQNHLAPEESHANFYRKIAEIDNGPTLPSRSSASLPRDTMMSRTSPRVSSDSGRSSPLLVGSNRNPSKPVPLNRRMQPSRKQMSLDDELHLVCAEEEKKTSRYHDVAFPKKSDTELLDELVSAGDYSTSESLVRRYSSDSTASYSSGPSSPQMSVSLSLLEVLDQITDVPTPTTASETNSLQNFEDIPDNRPSNWNGSANREDLPLNAGRGEYIDDGRSSTGHGPTQHHKGMEGDGGSYRDPQHSGTESSTPYRVKAEKDQRNRYRVKSTHEPDQYASPAKKTGRGAAVGKHYGRYPSSTSGSDLVEVTPLSKSQMADSPHYFAGNGHRRSLEEMALASESEEEDPYAADIPSPQKGPVKKLLHVDADIMSESEVDDPYAAESPNPITPRDKGISLDTSAWSDTPEALSPESTYMSRSFQSETESNASRRSRTPKGARKQVFRRLMSRTPSGRLKDSPALLEAYTKLTQSQGRCKSFSGLSDWSFDSYPASEVGAASEPGGRFYHSSRSTLTSSREAVRQSRTRSLDRAQAMRHGVSPPISPTNTRQYRTASEEELGRPTLYADEPDRRAINATLPQGTRAEVDVHHHNEDRASRARGTPPAKNRSVPTVAVEDSKEITRYPSSRNLEEFEDEDIDAYVRQYGSGSEKSASGSQRGSSLGASMSGSRESIMSYYSDAGDGYYGNIDITGDILLSLDYNFKNMVLAVNIKKCRDLAVADDKKKKSDPYVKTYLLPDKTKSGKRKTKVRKHTIKPTYDEVLKYSISPSELETRTLWASVWHNDMFGRNTFLGEVHLPLDNWDWDDRQARWYQLQQPVVPAGPKSTFQQYKGDLVISMKYVPSYKLLGGGSDTSRKGRRKGSPDRSSGEAGMGELHVFVKEARNLMAVRANGSSDPFVKGYLLPDKSKQSKQKTPYIKRNCNPTWNHTFVYKAVNPEELEQRCLELTVWDYDRMTSNDFLGGVRLSLGRVHAKTLVNLNTSLEGNRLGQPIEWMDSQGEEITAWRTMLNKPNVWVDSCLLLRPSMDYRVRPSTPAPSTTS
ncbi:synaptotagmin-like protein 5 isoform X2 [Branchiostoma floridae]|uniref:Synaptotagmin-like protein 5 isoform X2 n=1 Tax=Branchiostoma floridae TaxID=7739 RepID=A0A9J7LRF3_BRAFL|nr:synaptotagmin-like protein 5 isoform X2 [Branchiostoma floridae]